jgi:hypothetical protein
MRDPDETAEAGQTPEAPAEGASAARPRRATTPGGKPLLRLLELLGTAGYDQAAVETVDMAVDTARQESFRRHAETLVALPRAIAQPARFDRPGAELTDPEPAQEPAVSLQQRAGGRRVREAGDEEAARTLMRAAALLNEPVEATAPQWRSLGPWTVSGGQTYGSTRVNVSGRISTIAVDPSRPAHLLVGAANGGVWESFDRGDSWAPRTDDAATLAVGALAFDQADPATVYCGLGEGNWWWWLGAGVLRSTDGGTSWTTLCTDPFVGKGFHDLAVDPADGRHLIAATTGGLYDSVDVGLNWEQRHAPVSWALAVTGDEILAASSDGLLRSTDHGATYSAVPLPGAPAGFTRLAVAVAASNPSIAYAWGSGAPFDTDERPTPYLWRRSHGTWTAEAVPPDVSTGQSWYDWFLAVAPDDANQIYCGAISVHRGTRSGTGWAWLDVARKADGDSIHPDQHAIAFDTANPDMIYVGNDGGLYQSPDRGIHWLHRNNGLVISELEYLGQHVGTSRWLITGTQDNGTERWQGSAIWEHVADGDGGDCGVNRANPSIVFHTYYGMSLERSGAGGEGNSWTPISPPVPKGEGSPFYPPFESSATNGDTIAMAGQALYVSRNNGTDWSRLDYPTPASGSGLYIPDADTVLVGLDDGRILRTNWSAGAWAPPSPLATPRAGAAVSDIEVDGGNPARLWATYSRVDGGRVYRSDDAGASWTDYTTGLPNLPITAIALDPANPDRCWVSASLGVYQSLDGGVSWTTFAAGLPNAYVGDLLFHPHARVLRAGLRSRGAWEIPVDGWMTAPACGTHWTGELAANQTQRWFSVGWPATWHVLWTIVPTTVQSGAPQLSWKVQVERATAEFATYWITVTNLTANPVKFEGRYCVLSRY